MSQRPRERTIAHTRDLTRARDITRQLTVAHELVHDYVRTHDADADAELAHNLDRARDLIAELDLATKLDTDFYSNLGRASAIIDALGRDLGRVREHNRCYRNRRISLRVAAKHDIATDDGSSIPGRVPQGLVMLAVWMLPVHERPRYREEFGGELLDLPRQERLRYAVRTLLRAWELRRSLTGTFGAPDDAPVHPVER